MLSECFDRLRLVGGTEMQATRARNGGSAKWAPHSGSALCSIGSSKRSAMTKRQPARRGAAIPVTRGSGNVFADIGLPNPERHLAKAQLVSLIDDALRARGLTQQAAAALLGIDQPKVSRMLRGHFEGISTQRLLDFLTALGRDVEIVVRPAPKSRKRGRLHVAA